MAEKKRLLIVTQDLQPFTEESVIAQISNLLSIYSSENGFDLRVLMPRFGTINERRHRLHEVVRLSGMNIIVDDDDYPLVIKVASLPQSRLQTYFLDNDEFFKRKQVFADDDGRPFDDNADRMAFFCKGALETVKKFGWSPDIVHCHGWMTCLIPAYLKTAYKNDPVFANARTVFTMYQADAPVGMFGANFFSKASINNMTAKSMEPFRCPDGVDLAAGARHFSDGIISMEEGTDVGVKPSLAHHESEDNAWRAEYVDFYHKLINTPMSSGKNK